LNIAFVSDSVYPYGKGGKEKRLYELSTRLSRLGHEVHIYTMHWWKSPAHTIVEDGVQLHAISKKYPMYIGDRRSIREGIMFGLACLKLIRVRFDVLDVDHMPFFPIYSAWIVCTLRGRVFYGTWHEALTRKDWREYMGAAGAIAAVIERISIHLPRYITAASRHTQALIASELKRTRRVNVVASGIDIGLIASVQPDSHKTDVLYVGRLVKDKHVDKLVRAIGIVAKARPSVRATIIGHGVERDNIRTLIGTLRLQRQVRLFDPLPKSEDVYGHMKASKLFCLASSREGFGIVALEALGCDTPVITTDYPANAAKDLITEGRNGSIVAGTPEAIAVAITHWLDAAKVVPKAIADSVIQYDWDALACAQAAVYTS
jgi:glycosyltransferase involved in cell wall biosynthesis